MKDLYVLCADLNAKAVLEALLRRPKSLDIRQVDYDVYHNPIGHDGGTRADGPALVRRAAAGAYSHAMVVIDWEGCGATGDARGLERELTARLSTDWADRGQAIVIDPELEAWLVGAHRHFGKVCRVRPSPVRKWLAQAELWPMNDPKPARPKEAVEAWLRAHRARRTSANYRKIAAAASLRLERCRSESFGLFVRTLRRWFPKSSPTRS